VKLKVSTTQKLLQCSRCVMDKTADEITFDSNGVCNFCTELINHSSKIRIDNASERSIELSKLVEKIKKDGLGKPYDCIIGVSGGVDSSWALIEAIKQGLRPLAVHLDNGWNSELAQNNISSLIQMLGVDLYTHVIDWEEYKTLMQGFFDADVIDVELLYDNAMLAVNYQLAKKYDLKFILSGSNRASEGMRMPANWNWFKLDKSNIFDIAKKKTKIKPKTFPSIGVFNYLCYRYINGIQWVPFLDYIEYNKSNAMTLLEREYGCKRYPYKHYESIFTRFYQGYLLPNKFNVDKRKLHFSSLIIAGQMSRDEALDGLNEPAHISESAVNEDIKYFLKKMKWSQDDLDFYLSRPAKSHSLFMSEKWMWNILLSLNNALKSRKR
jgi:N-acetyl sugar amidotransferase